MPYQSARGRSPSASCLMHDRPFHGAPQPSDELWRRFHDVQLPCYARLLPYRCPLESIFRLFKPRASYEPFIEPPAQAGIDYSSASRQLPRARVTIYGHVAQYGRGSLPEECSTSAPWRQAREAHVWPQQLCQAPELTAFFSLFTHLFSFGPQSARAGGEVTHVDLIDRSSSVVPTGRRGLGIFPLARALANVPLLRSKQEEHFLLSPSSFFPLLSRNPTGTLAGFRSNALFTRQLLPYGRQELHLPAGCRGRYLSGSFRSSR